MDGGDPEYINMMDFESVSTQIEAVYEPHYEHSRLNLRKVIQRQVKNLHPRRQGPTLMFSLGIMGTWIEEA